MFVKVRSILIVSVFLLLWGCKTSRTDFALDNSPDTLSLIEVSVSEGTFIRRLDLDGTKNTYTGNYWIEGKNCWVYPWYGIAYGGGALYLSDSGMVNFGIRRDIFGRIKSLYLDDDGEEYRRIK